MFDPNFNPYDTLLTVQQQLIKTSTNIQQLATAYNARADQQDKIVEQLNIHTDTINRQSQILEEINQRLLRLEKLQGIYND